MIAAIVVRDIFITCMRSLLVARGASLTTVWVAKVKTVLQLGAVYVFVIAHAALRGQLGPLSPAMQDGIVDGVYYLGVLVAGATIITGMVYIPQFYNKR